MHVFRGEVIAKSPGLYQVTNWSYGQKTKKGGVIVRKWGVKGRKWGVKGELWVPVFRGRSTRKPQVSIKSQTGVMAKKLKKGGKWGSGGDG